MQSFIIASSLEWVVDAAFRTSKNIAIVALL